MKSVKYDHEVVLVAKLSAGARRNAVVKKWAAFALAWSVRWRLGLSKRVLGCRAG
jgi:hypothetical protein